LNRRRSNEDGAEEEEEEEVFEAATSASEDFLILMRIRLTRETPWNTLPKTKNNVTELTRNCIRKASCSLEAEHEN